jgi:hypothetical protein
MATWKKVSVSGSNISQFVNDSGYITATTANHAFATASFDGAELLAGSTNGNLTFGSGSGGGLNITADAGSDTLTFNLDAVPNSSLQNDSLRIGNTSIALGTTGSSVDGVVLTDVIATGSFSGSFTGNLNVNLEDLTPGDGLSGSAYDGNIARTFTVNTSSQHIISGSRQAISVQNTTGASGITMNYNTAGNGVISSTILNDNITIGATNVALGGTALSIANLKLTDAEATGSFSGSFTGDGSGITGIASTLDVSGSSGNGTIALKTQDFSILGTANEIDTSMANQTLTIGMPDDVTIGQDLSVTRDLTVGANATVSGNLVVVGTASFQHSEDLDVADRFIRLASGSNSVGDGGIVIQQTSPAQGEAFAYDAATTRWSMTGSFDPSTEAYTPDAFVSTVVVGSGGTQSSDVVSKYTKAGNIFTSASGDIWIYS